MATSTGSMKRNGESYRMEGPGDGGASGDDFSNSDDENETLGECTSLKFQAK
jgi:hypothetical protein